MKVKIYNKIKIGLISLAMLGNFLSCSEDDTTSSEQGTSTEENSFEEVLNLKKDKARYNPGETVIFSVSEVQPNTLIRYKYLGNTISEEPLSSVIWNWSPPNDDFRGYMVELVQHVNSEEKIIGTVAVDVSSDWTKFPRYGFLSGFGDISENERNDILDNLKDFHINGLQYYDWHYKHHIPLPLNENGTPWNDWNDLFNREVKLETVQGYVDSGHQKNIASMFYNLLFGALSPESGDGFSESWLLFRDSHHTTPDSHDLGSFGSILVANPANPEWQSYIFQKTSDIYSNLDFDGWHVDQLGDRGTLYDYGGYQVDLKNGYNNFMNAVIQQFPDKKHVMNAVDQFGQNEILSAPVNFAYTEVWSRSQYADLVQVISENNQISGNQLKTVLAAYMNYGNSEGYFNTPSVLLTDAVIFAFGGYHLELGEHMLSNEYFPNNSLQMESGLKSRLKEFYDFRVAYENLLDSPVASVQVSSEETGINQWPPVTGRTAVVSKQTEDRKVVQLLNFDGVSTLSWKDTSRIQTKPVTKSGFKISIHSGSPVSKVWFASPDYNGGASSALDFEQSNGKITVTIPYLEYWSMIVLEN